MNDDKRLIEIRASIATLINLPLDDGKGLYYSRHIAPLVHNLCNEVTRISNEKYVASCNEAGLVSGSI